MRQLFSAALLTIFVCACTTAPFHRMDAAAHGKFQSVDVRVAAPQSEIYARIDPSHVAAAAGGGLIPALIDAAVENSRTKAAEALMQPIRDAMLDLNVATAFKQSVDTDLQGIDWLHARPAQVVGVLDDTKINEALANLDASALLVVRLDYYFTPAFDKVGIDADVVLYPKDQALFSFKEEANNSGQFKPGDNLYRNHFSSVRSLVIAGDAKSNSARLALPDGPPKVRQALQDASAELVVLINKDLQNTTPPPK